MSVGAFHAGAGRFGLLTSIMAIGSVTGTLFSAGRERPRMGVLVAGAALFGIGLAAGALMPSYGLFGLTLAVVGASAQTFTTTANGAVQLRTEPAMRGRVMAIFLAIALGGTPLGAPFVGWVADVFGPRRALCVGAAAGFGAALVGLRHLARTPRAVPSPSKGA
jgi:predicted MFS family arabinose efflux permease